MILNLFFIFLLIFLWLHFFSLFSFLNTHNKANHEEIIFLNFFFLSLMLFEFQTGPKVVLGSPKVLRKEKILTKMTFSCFDVY